MTIEVLTVAGKVQPVDLLLFKRLKREVPGLVEQTYGINPGLADLGPLLPIGTQVSVIVPAASTAPIRKLIRLTGT